MVFQRWRRRRKRRRRRRMREEGNSGRMPTAARERGRAHTTDTIAAINTGEQPLTSPTGGPILYFISKLIPREQIYCKKGVKKYIFSLSLSLGPLLPTPVFQPPAACRPIHLTYRVNVKVPGSTRVAMVFVFQDPTMILVLILRRVFCAFRLPCVKIRRPS